MTYKTITEVRSLLRFSPKIFYRENDYFSLDYIDILYGVSWA